MQYKLQITLQSDLLPGKGTGYGASVDTDICFDDFGLPYIPAKRVKGCLLEGAKMLGRLGCNQHDRVLESLFGDENEQGDLQIQNLQVAHAHEIRQGILRQKALEKGTQSEQPPCWLTPENVLACYTAIRSQTAINESGYAKDNSLRTSRVIRSGHVFEGVLEMPSEPEYKEAVRLCARAMTHMGTMRTRGLGEVRVEIIDLQAGSANLNREGSAQAETGAENNRPVPSDAGKQSIIIDMLTSKDPGTPSVLQVTLHLRAPVLVSDLYGGDTLRYIPGSALRGCVCAAYIKDCRDRKVPAPPNDDYSNDDTFRTLFLKGALQFTCGMVTDAVGTRYTPLPASMVAYKTPEEGTEARGSKGINLFRQEPDRQTKAYGGKYIHAKAASQGQATEYQHLAVKQRISYHHNRQDQAFFSYTALAEGQRFAFEIHGEHQYVRQIADILDKYPNFSLGRSRTAEYGASRIESLRITQQQQETTKPSKHYVATLITPCCIMDENGMCVTDAATLLQSIERNLALRKSSLTLDRAFLKNRSVGGYNPIWRLSKPMIQVLDLGTAITFYTDQVVALPKRLWIGGRRSEGMGEIALEELDATPIDAVLTEQNVIPQPETGTESDEFSRLWQQIAQREAARQIKACALNKPLPKSKDINMGTVNALMASLKACETLEAFVREVAEITAERKRNAVIPALFGSRLSNDEFSSRGTPDLWNPVLKRLESDAGRHVQSQTEGCQAVKAAKCEPWFSAGVFWYQQLEQLKFALRATGGVAE